jgi:hypothetical protein
MGSAARNPLYNIPRSFARPRFGKYGKFLMRVRRRKKSEREREKEARERLKNYFPLCNACKVLEKGNGERNYTGRGAHKIHGNQLLCGYMQGFVVERQSRRMAFLLWQARSKMNPKSHKVFFCSANLAFFH